MHSERPASLILGFLLLHVDRSPGIEAVPSHTTGLVPLPPPPFPPSALSPLFHSPLSPWYYSPSSSYNYSFPGISFLSFLILFSVASPLLPSPFSLSPGTPSPSLLLSSPSHLPLPQMLISSPFPLPRSPWHYPSPHLTTTTASHRHDLFSYPRLFRTSFCFLSRDSLHRKILR